MKYIHTNLIARDWRRLAGFYERVFACVRIPPERDLFGDEFERGTGISGAQIRGVHLRLPGYGDDGPTLEVFEYHSTVEAALAPANRVGFGHIAFAVDDVVNQREAAIAAGATPLGTVETVNIAGAGTIIWTYIRDPEGNIIELQQKRAG